MWRKLVSKSDVGRKVTDEEVQSSVVSVCGENLHAYSDAIVTKSPIHCL